MKILHEFRKNLSLPASRLLPRLHKERAQSPRIDGSTARHIFTQITAPDTTVFERMAKQRTTLMLELEATGARHSTIILEVDPAGSYFVIDELSGGGLVEDSIGETIRIRGEAVLDRERVRFSSAITGTARGSDVERFYHRVRMPTDLQYRTSRTWRRISIAMNPRVSVSLRPASSLALIGLIRDVSAGGFGATLTVAPGGRAPRLGEKIERCVIHTPTGRQLLAGIQVCHVSTFGLAGTIRLGAKFLSGTRPDIAANLMLPSSAA